MTFIVADRVQETTNSPGTGTATLLGAVSGYQSFSTGIGANNTTYYVIADQLGTNWEVGLGALNSTGTVLTRTTVYSSSNGGSTVNFATGIQYVWCDYPSSKAVIQGTAVNFSSIGATTAGTGAFTTLSASSTVSGAGFSNYFASPPTIGNTTPNAGTFTTLTGTSVTDSGLTSTQLVFAGTGGLLSGTSSLTWDGTKLTVAGNTVFNSTGAVVLPNGTTGQQPTGVAGMLRFNSTTTQFEGYNGTTWSSVGGAAISNDTATASNLYPLFANATSGTALTVYTSNAKYLYKPSTGDLQAPQLLANNGLVLNATTLVSSYTIPSGINASSIGPFTVPSGLSVTVPSGQRWVVL